MQRSKAENVVVKFGIVLIALVVGLLIYSGYMSEKSTAEAKANAKQEYMDSCSGVTWAQLKSYPSKWLYQKVHLTGTIVAYGRSKTDSSDVVIEIFPEGCSDSDVRVYALLTVSSSTLTGVEAGDEITVYGIYVGDEEYNVKDGYYSSATIMNMLGADSPNIEVKYFTYTSK